MGIKCSLLGHAFGDATVEREREEQGSEVVITIREIETCSRCGESRVVSENKEVTTLETPDDVGQTPADNAGSSPDIADAEADVEPGEPPDDETPTEQTEDADTPTEVTGSAEESTAVDTDVEPTPEGPPVTDDAEILDDTEPQREPGEWPQEADSEADSQDDEPVEDTEDEQTDAEFIDDEPSSDQPRTNEWPSEDEIDAAGEGEPVGPGAVTVPDGSFVCEECGFSTPTEASSLREGDYCPECHRGTLVQVRNADN